MMPDVAILAGGLATRLGEAARAVPKSLQEVAGRPFLYHQLDLLRESGVGRVVLCTGHLGGQIAAAVPAANPWGLTVTCSPDGPVPLGTGGALRQALPLLGDPFFVLYGDSYLPVGLGPIAASFPAEALALMTVYRNDGGIDRSNVRFEGGRILRYDKRHPDPAMRHIDYGLGLFRHAAFAEGPAAGPFDLADLQARLAAAGRLAAWESPERFYEIGSPDGLAELRQHLAVRQGRS